MPHLLNRIDIRVSLAYLIIAALWILLSDAALESLHTANETLMLQLNTYKGLGFVIMTTLGLFVVLRRELRRRQRVEDRLTAEVKEHVNTEQALRLMTRLYRMLSGANQILVRGTDEAHLLQSVCDLLVEEGGYHLVWVGYAEQDARKSVMVKAVAGYQNGYLKAIDITWDDAPTGQGPTGTAIRTGEPCIARFILTDPRFALWRKQALDRGYASSIALPIRVNDHVIGALNVYSSAADAFDTSETALLHELATDLGFGIQVLRLSRENQITRAELEQERDISPIGISVLTAEGKLRYVNARASEMMGLPLAQIIGRDHDAPEWRITDHEGRPILPDQLPFARAARLKRPVYGSTCAIEKPDGTRVLLEINAAPLLNPDGGLHEVVVTFADVTESEGIRADLHRSNQYLRTLIESSPLGILSFSMDGSLLNTNPAARRILDLADDADLNGSTVFERVVDTTELRRLQARVASGETITGVETQWMRQDGEIIDLAVSAGPHFNRSGQIVGGIILLQDISERKRILNSLRDSEERYRSLIDSLDEYAVFTTNADGYIMNWNRGGERITGYCADEIIGQHLSLLYTDDDISSDRPAEVLRQAVEQGTFREEAWRRRKDGTRYWAEVYIVPLKDIDGKVWGFSRVVRDLTQRRQAEEQMRYQAQLIASVSDAVVATDLEFRIRSWNRAAEQLYGWQADEVIGRLTTEVIPTVYVNNDEDTARSELLRDGQWRGEVSQPHRDGTPIALMASVSLTTDSAGQPTGAVAINRDIRERKRAEQAMQRYNQRITILHQIDSDIIAAQSPDAITRTVLRHIRALIGCDRAALTTLDEAAGTVTIEAVEGMDSSELPPGSQIPFFRDQFVDLMESGQTLLISDLTAIEGPVSDLMQTLVNEGFRSLLSAPLFIQDRLYGSLSLVTHQVDFFTGEHSEIASELAAQLAIAFHNARLSQTLHINNLQLQTLSVRLVEAQETERRHIARELHDEVGQTLTALSLMLTMEARHAQEAGSPSATLGEAQVLVSDLMKRIRQISLDLRPSMLDDLGLIPTLIWFFNRYEQQTQIRVEFNHSDADQRFGAAVETTVYRIIQEALTNIARHARVSQASVSLWVTGATLFAQIEDAGVGFDAGAVTQAAKTGGILSLRERAQIVSGTCSIESSVGEGTIISLSIPLQPGDAREKAR